MQMIWIYKPYKYISYICEIIVTSKYTRIIAHSYSDYLIMNNLNLGTKYKQCN